MSLGATYYGDDGGLTDQGKARIAQKMDQAEQTIIAAKNELRRLNLSTAKGRARAKILNQRIRGVQMTVGTHKADLAKTKEVEDDLQKRRDKATPLASDIGTRFKQVTGIDYPLKKAAEALQRIPQSQFKQMVLEELDNILNEGNKAAKTVGDPPYRERGSTESQAQQKAAGMALSARRGDTPVSKLKGAAKDLYSGEISTKDLRNLAKLGQKVKQHKSKEPKHLKSLPGHATPAKD
tara:strand:- start:15257 stop:15967 length:711 start_codon:yes stop_codon:yes gene_type:complete